MSKPKKCCKCNYPAEVWWPDPNRPGEQIGYCGDHEPTEATR